MENQNSSKGTVVNCLWCYIYEREDILSNALGTFPMLKQVDVLENYAIDPSFYAVITNDEKIGYCLKDYIVLHNYSTMGESDNG